MGSAAAADWRDAFAIIAPLLANRAGFRAAELLSAGIRPDGGPSFGPQEREKSTFSAAGVGRVLSIKIYLTFGSTTTSNGLIVSKVSGSSIQLSGFS